MQKMPQSAADAIRKAREKMDQITKPSEVPKVLGKRFGSSRAERALVQISAVEVDWLQGLLSAGEAMLAVSVILKNSKELTD